MAELITVNAREPLMEVSAVEKAFEDLGLYRPVDQRRFNRRFNRRKR
jgi:hypothetical protein